MSKGSFHNPRKIHLERNAMQHSANWENFNTLIYLVINKLVNFIHIMCVEWLQIIGILLFNDAFPVMSGLRSKTTSCSYQFHKSESTVYMLLKSSNFFISRNFSFSFVSTSLVYITIHKNIKEKQKFVHLR